MRAHARDGVDTTTPPPPPNTNSVYDLYSYRPTTITLDTNGWFMVLNDILGIMIGIQHSNFSMFVFMYTHICVFECDT